MLKYNEIKFTRFDKKLILDFTDPKKWDVFIVHANFHWSKDFEFKYIYTCIGSLSRMIVHHVKIFASLDKNSHKFSHDMQDQRLFVPNFLSPKLLNPHELSSLGGKKSKPFELVPIAIFQPPVYRTCSRIFRSFHNLFRNWSSNQSVHRAFRSAGAFRTEPQAA